MVDNFFKAVSKCLSHSVQGNVIISAARQTFSYFCIAEKLLTPIKGNGAL